MKDKHRTGFALVEALVIAAVAAMLASLFFFAAFHRARSTAQDARCLNNLRRLTLGWQMYSSDNSDVLSYNEDESDEPTTLTSANHEWCPGLVNTDAGTEPTNTAWIKIGQIYPYVGDPSYYRCPSDTSTYNYQRQAVYPLGGPGNPRVRSVSMNSWVGTTFNAQAATIGGEANNYRIYRTEPDLAIPGAANLFLLTDDNPYSINDAFFWEQPANAGLNATTTWVDYPATYHNGSGGISFCDGHAQMRRWTDPAVIGLKTEQPGSLPATPPRTDLLWLLRRTTAHK